MRILDISPENRDALLLGLEYLIGISCVDYTKVFKVCLDYWNVFVLNLFEAHNQIKPAAAVSMMGLQAQMIPGVVDGVLVQLFSRGGSFIQVHYQNFECFQTPLMAKPKESLIVEHENGNIVRETMKDSDVLVQYKIMGETLIYLSHLNHEDTEQQMLEKLSEQLNGGKWSWNDLSTLYWAIGSISGSMVEEQENSFLVMVIRDLINLCEITKGNDNKALIASNIMNLLYNFNSNSPATNDSHNDSHLPSFCMPCPDALG